MSNGRKKILYLGAKRYYYRCYSGVKSRRDVFLELFKEELSRHHEVLCWGEGYSYNFDWKKTKISDAVNIFGQPDIVITHDLGRYYKVGILDLSAVKMHIVGDFYYGMGKQQLKRHVSTFKSNGYDCLLATNLSAYNLLKDNFPDDKCFFWPFSVDVNFFRNYYMDRKIDVFFAGASRISLYGEDRKLILKMLEDMYSDGINTVFEKRVFGRYVDILNSSKVCIHNNSKYKFTTKRFLEIMACGSLLLTDKCEEYDALGFEDGKHIVVYNDLDDLRDKIHYYLANDIERKRIANNGYCHTISKCSTMNAIVNLIDIYSRRINKNA